MGIAIDLISYYSSCWFDDIVGSPQLLRSESLWGASPVGSQLRCGSSIPGADDAPHGASRRRQGGFKWAATPRWITVWHHRGKQHGTTILKSFVFFFWGGVLYILSGWIIKTSHCDVTGMDGWEEIIPDMDLLQFLQRHHGVSPLW